MKLGRTEAKPPVSIEDRINALRAEIDAFIDERVTKEAKECPGVPVGVLRNLLTARAGECQCKAYLNLTENQT